MIELPIHTSWKSMVRSFLNNPKYCKKNPKRKCYKFQDGKRICGCRGGWSVFFATINRMGADETKPVPKKRKNFNESKVVAWFINQSKEHPVLPKWIGLAQKIINSPQFEESVKVFWGNKLKEYCKEYPEASICKEGDENAGN